MSRIRESAAGRRPKGAVSGDSGRMLARCVPELEPVARELCSVIGELLPDAVTTWDGENLGFGDGPGYRGLIFVVTPHASTVNLGISRALGLPDPTRLLEGTGKLHRHVKLRSRKDVSSSEFRSLLRAAVKRRTAGALLP